MNVSTQPPSGFRDFVGAEAQLRLKLMREIAEVYESFGFLPIETPALENLNVLMGSGGGDENEKLIFKVMKRGEKLAEAVKVADENTLADFGLRFDMTVPLARIVANYRGNLAFPLKAFHMGPVWRAERAQKGRYREFIQCDIDIVGAKSTSAELEVIQVVGKAFEKVGAKGFHLHLSDRRFLKALALACGAKAGQEDQFAILIDKKDKVSPADLKKEIVELCGSSQEKTIDEVLSGNFSLRQAKTIHPEAIGQLEKLMEDLAALQLSFSEIIFDPTLARGLGYYTGSIFEVRHPSAGFSLGGGGRYDQLIGRFSKQEVPACGFSIGFERLLLLLAEQIKAKEDLQSKSVFFPIFSEGLRLVVLKLAQEIRQQGIHVDVYPEEAKLKAQLKFASDRNYRWVLILGEDEQKNAEIKLKDFASGEEKILKQASLLSTLKGIL